MQNQQEDTFVFGQSVKGFLKRYQADAKFAQEARKKAEGVLDDTVQLVCPEDIRPLALKVVKRLAKTEIELFSLFVKRGDDPVTELGNRLRKSTSFSKFVFFQVAPKFAQGKVDLRCNKGNRRLLKEALQTIWDSQSATRNGWQTLIWKNHVLTGTRTLTKVEPWEVEGDFTPNSGRDFQVLQRLGYKANITWKEAAELDARDPIRHIHLFGASAPMLRVGPIIP